MSSNETQTGSSEEIFENENEKSTDILDSLDDELLEEEKKFTLRIFLKKSGLTISFASLAIILMVVGLIVFYRINGSLSQNAGFWMILLGVGIFLLTVIFGFEKLE